VGGGGGGRGPLAMEPRLASNPRSSFFRGHRRATTAAGVSVTLPSPGWLNARSPRPRAGCVDDHACDRVGSRECVGTWALQVSAGAAG
jgi:hypothetical protein